MKGAFMFFAFVWFLTIALIADWIGKRAKGGLGALFGFVAFVSGAIALVWLLLIGAVAVWF